jgi:hypothetical protein
LFLKGAVGEAKGAKRGPNSEILHIWDVSTIFIYKLNLVALKLVQEDVLVILLW